MATLWRGWHAAPTLPTYYSSMTARMNGTLAYSWTDFPLRTCQLGPVSQGIVLASELLSVNHGGYHFTQNYVICATTS